MDSSQRRKAIGARLRAARRRLNLSQVDVSRELRVSQQTIASWEVARSLPQIETLVDLCILYGTQPNELLFGEECCRALETRLPKGDALPGFGRVSPVDQGR